MSKRKGESSLTGTVLGLVTDVAGTTFAAVPPRVARLTDTLSRTGTDRGGGTDLVTLTI